MKNLFLICFALFLFSSLGANAQQDSCKVCKPYPWEIGVPLGVNQYFGDMHCSRPYRSQNSLMTGVFLRKHVGEYFAIRPQVLVGRLAGNDLDHPDGYWNYRRLKFTSPLVEGAIIGEIYPFKDLKYTCDGVMMKRLAPYLFAGIGATYTNPKVTVQSGATFPPLQRDLDADAQNLKKVGLVLPFGIGLKYNATERLSLGVEGGYRYSLSDYLDGIKQAATSSRYNDGYFLADVWASYRFGSKDSDKDGVVDKCDWCPNEKGLRKFQGCPDTDGDGIPDKDDACPTQAGPLALKGCPDTDGDGIADKDDACPTVVGSAALNGCPDSDGDGIADKDDACPTVAGVAALKGCPDADGDGIADKDDQCLNEAGAANLNGCPDTDGDGIIDKDDKCPTQAGTAANNGCPDAPVTAFVPAPCNCSGTVFNIPTATAPKPLNRLGTNPEFGNSVGLTPAQFYNKLKRAYAASAANRTFLDDLFRNMGYSNGFAGVNAAMFSETFIPYGTSGNIGFSKAHRTQYSTLNLARPQDLAAFKVTGANGCDIHFMKVCGNHFYFCPTR